MTIKKERETFFVNLFFIICFLSAIIFAWKMFKNRGLSENSLWTNQKYTIATYDSDYDTYPKGLGGVSYSYSYKDEIYRNYQGPVNEESKKGELSLIIFDSINPKNAAILELYKFKNKDSVPPNGWRLNEVPVPIDTSYVHKRISSSYSNDYHYTKK